MTNSYSTLVVFAIWYKNLVDPDDVLTREEAALVRKGEWGPERGEFVALDQLEHEIQRKAGKRSRKTAWKDSSGSAGANQKELAGNGRMIRFGGMLCR